MKIDDIETLIKLFDRSGLAELELEQGETKLMLRRTRPASRPASPGDAPTEAGVAGHSAAPEAPAPTREEPSPAGTPAPDAGAAEEGVEGYVVSSPIVGTFYRRPSPEEEPYVTVGDRVEAGDTVCIVEAMKVMNEVRTERAGIVKEILVEDSAAVEYGQALLRIDES